MQKTEENIGIAADKTRSSMPNPERNIDYENLIDILLEENNKLHLANLMLQENNDQLSHTVAFMEGRERNISQAFSADLSNTHSEALHWLNIKIKSQRRGFLNLKSNKQKYLLRTAAAIKDTGAFTEEWYFSKYPDVRESGISPIEHYVRHGFAEGRFPHPLFDTHWYLERYRDVLVSGQNPFLHYLTTGWRERRDPNKHFHVGWYLNMYKDVAEAELEPMCHYYRFGARELRDPSRFFSTKIYVNRNNNVDFDKVNPLEHFMNSLSNS